MTGVPRMDALERFREFMKANAPKMEPDEKRHELLGKVDAVVTLMYKNSLYAAYHFGLWNNVIESRLSDMLNALLPEIISAVVLFELSSKGMRPTSNLDGSITKLVIGKDWSQLASPKTFSARLIDRYRDRYDAELGPQKAAALRAALDAPFSEAGTPGRRDELGESIRKVFSKSGLPVAAATLARNAMFDAVYCFAAAVLIEAGTSELRVLETAATMSVSSPPMFEIKDVQGHWLAMSK
jgi:hypothetical protein